MNKQTAEKRLAELFMNDLPIVEFTPRDTCVVPDWFTKYRGLRRDFMKSLTDSVSDLAFLNLSQDEFMGLIMGRKMPDNLSIRFRTPLVWGGDLNITNMFLCRTFPHAHNMDRFIIEQSGNTPIWLPSPAHRVYIPAHVAGGGAGGNATEDRLSQLSAGFANDRD